MNEDADNSICFCCGIEWEEDDNWWIVCNLCDKPYHLHCSGIQYNQQDYYDIDIENIDFICEECE